MDWTLSEEGQHVLASQNRVPIRTRIRAADPEATREGLSFFPSLDTPNMLREAQERNKIYDALLFGR
jgi:ABC-type Fe3+ transport system substrate-binding protein